jgi:hypothetical protein
MWLAFGVMMAGCTSLVGPYDATFDQSLNKLSEDTAKFIAAAEAGGLARESKASETVAYYAATYNVLDRLAERARLQRRSLPCPSNAAIVSAAAEPTSATTLPPDFASADCRENILYSVRLNVDQLHYFHSSGGALSGPEARTAGLSLQKSIMGAIMSFQIDKPDS